MIDKVGLGLVRLIGMVRGFRLSGLRFSTRSEHGQDLIEYALLSGVIALAMVGIGAGLYTGALTDMAAGISDCVDFKKTTTCAPF